MLGAWMKLPMDGLQSLLIDVRVNLRRRNVGMAEHLLNDPKVCAIAEEVRRETVAQ